MCSWRIALLERFWQARHPPRYAAFTPPSSPSSRHSSRPLSSGCGRLFMVEARCGAVAVGWAYLFPPLSSGGASLAQPWLRFHIPLIEPDVQISRIRLSDKGSRLRPRLAAPARGRSEPYQAKMAVQVRERIGPAPSSPDLVLETQPPAQPHRGVVVESAIRPRDRADIKVVGPAAQRTVQLVHQPCGVLPCPPLDGQRMDRLDHVPNALLRWP